MSISFEGYLEGPRWVFGPSTILKAAVDFGIQGEIIREEKRLPSRTVFFKVTGDRHKVRAFQHSLYESVKDWNAYR